MNDTNKQIIGICVLIVVGMILWFRLDFNAVKADQKHHEMRMVLGTVVNVDVCIETVDEKAIVMAAMSSVWKVFFEIERSMSKYKQTSDVGLINHSDIEPVEVAPMTYELIEKSFKFSELTMGAFDISVMPYVHLWSESQEKGVLPSDQDLRALKDAIGSINFSLLAAKKIKRHNKQSQIDLGAIAKGFAIDKAAGILSGFNFVDFMIDAGGDVYVSGRNCNGKKWRIGVRDPRKKESLLDVLHISDVAVTTSGDYERYFEIDGKRYSHIIDPRTGKSANKVLSATVIAPTAVEADALSTALCVLGSVEGEALIESLGGDYASVMIEKNEKGKPVESASKKYKKYLKK